MTRPFAAPPSGETIRRIRELHETALSLPEYQRRRAIPLTQAELEETRELVNWFRTRYPTPAERSAYIREAMSRWLGEFDRNRP